MFYIKTPIFLKTLIFRVPKGGAAWGIFCGAQEQGKKQPAHPRTHKNIYIYIYMLFAYIYSHLSAMCLNTPTHRLLYGAIKCLHKRHDQEVPDSHFVLKEVGLGVNGHCRVKGASLALGARCEIALIKAIRIEPPEVRDHPHNSAMPPPITCHVYGPVLEVILAMAGGPRVAVP